MSADVSDRRAQLDAVLRPFVLEGSSTSGVSGASMTERRVAATARDAAAAILPLLGPPRRSAHRVRSIIMPVLTCGWMEFDAVYASALEALLALPPAVAGVDDPAWDAEITPEPPARRTWLDDGQWRAPPFSATETIAPGGTVGRVVQRTAKSLLISEDGRPIRIHSRCECDVTERRARPTVPYELVHLRRNGSVLDVIMGAACGGCRAPIE